MFYCVLPVASPTTSMLDNGSFKLERDTRIDIYYTSSNRAHEEATRLAAKKPGEQFAVMAMSYILETTTPKVIKKIINDYGELVMEKV